MAHLLHTPPIGIARIACVFLDDLLCLYANRFWYFCPRVRFCERRSGVSGSGKRQSRRQKKKLQAAAAAHRSSLPRCGGRADAHEASIVYPQLIRELRS